MMAEEAINYTTSALRSGNPDEEEQEIDQKKPQADTGRKEMAVITFSEGHRLNRLFRSPEQFFLI
jgi:hypothetical protein